MSHAIFRKNQSQNKGPGDRLFFYGWVVAIAGMVILFTYNSATNTFGVFLKPLVEEFSSSRAIISGAVSTRAFFNGILAIVVGVLIDKFGSRKILLICISLFSLGLLLLSTASSIWQVYLYFGFLVGIGSSAFYTATISTVARWFGEKSTTALAILTSGYGLGAVITPPLLSLILINFGWRLGFVILGLLVLFISSLALIWLRPAPEQSDYLPHDNTTVRIENNINLASGSTAIEHNDFAFREALYTRSFWFLFAIFVIYALSYQMLMTHIVANATDVGIKITLASFALTWIGISSIIGRLLAGVIASRIGSKAVLTFGFIICVPVLLWLTVADEAWQFYVISAVFGLGHGTTAPLIPNITTVYFGKKSIGSLVGAQSLAYSIGNMVGPFLAGYIYDVTHSYSWAFSIAAMTMVLGSIISVLLKPPKKAGWT